MTKTFLLHLTRPEAYIVHVSSKGGFLPMPGQTNNGASEAAVKLLTEGLHSELMDTTVRVSLVFPGAVNRDIFKNSGINNLRQSTPENRYVQVLSPVKAAQAIVDGMENNRYRILVGRHTQIMDLFYRVNPMSAAEMISNQMKRVLSWEGL